MTIAERHNPLAPQIDAINSDLAALEARIMIIRSSDNGTILDMVKPALIADLNREKADLFNRKRQLIANAKALK